MANHDDFDERIRRARQQQREQANTERQVSEEEAQRTDKALAYARYAAQLLVAARIQPKKITQVRRGGLLNTRQTQQIGTGWDVVPYTYRDGDFPSRNGMVLEVDGNLREYSPAGRGSLGELCVSFWSQPICTPRSAEGVLWRDTAEWAITQFLAQNLPEPENQ